MLIINLKHCVYVMSYTSAPKLMYYLNLCILKRQSDGAGTNLLDLRLPNYSGDIRINCEPHKTPKRDHLVLCLSVERIAKTKKKLYARHSDKPKQTKRASDPHLLDNMQDACEFGAMA